MPRARWIAASLLMCVVTLGLLEVAVRIAIHFDLAGLRDPARYAHPFCDDDYHRLRILWSERLGLSEFEPDSLIGWSRPAPPALVTDSDSTAADRPRIAFFGDSFMAGVPPTLESERIPALVASALPAWQVIDRSAPGYGPDQMYLSLVDLVQDDARRPQMCVVGLLLDDMDRVIEEFRDAPKPHFELDEAGLLLRGIPVPTIEESLKREPPRIKSYVLAMVRTSLAMSRDRGAPWESRCRAAEKVSISRTLLEHMVRTCDAYGVSLAFVIFYGEPELPARTWREQQLQAMLAALGRPIIDTRGALAGRASSELYFPPPNGHLNGVGNQIVARQVLEELGLAPAAPDSLHVLFGTSGNSLRFVREGWHVAGEKDTFTSKTRSSIELRGDSGRSYHATLAVGRIAARPGDRRVLTISSGDQIAGRWPVDALVAKGPEQTLEFDIRADDAGRIRITLDLPWLHRAEDVSIPHDSRVLGLAVRSLRLAPSEDQAGAVAIGQHDLGGRAFHTDPSVVEKNDPVAGALNGHQVVGHDHHRFAAGMEVGHAREALLLERFVADREDFVHEEHVGIHVGRHREAEPCGHSRRVILDGNVDETLQLRELHDPVEFRPHLLSREPVERAGEVDVLFPGQLRIESRSEIDERGDAAVHGELPRSGNDEPGEESQERGLAAAVVPDDAERLSGADRERDAVERTELFDAETLPAQVSHERFLERHRALVHEPELEREIPRGDRLRVGVHDR